MFFEQSYSRRVATPVRTRGNVPFGVANEFSTQMSSSFRKRSLSYSVTIGRPTSSIESVFSLVWMLWSDGGGDVPYQESCDAPNAKPCVRQTSMPFAPRLSPNESA